jgi:thioredoxin-like negative regulator of GroEL
MPVEKISLGEGSFHKYIDENDCLVLIFKNQCPICKVLSKVMDKCMLENPGLKVAEVDSEANSGLMTQMDISKVPTILVYKSGQLAARKTGVIKANELVDFYQNA